MSCNPTKKTETNNTFVQRNNFFNAGNKKYFSRTKRKNQIGRNGYRMKNHEDMHACKEMMMLERLWELSRWINFW